MATIEKRKKPRTNPLGAPPTPDEARGNLMEPEAAPAVSAVTSTQKKRPEEGRGTTNKKARPSVKQVAADGRTLRKTGRTEQFSTRVHPDFKQELFDVAQVTGKNYNVILEESLDLYKKQNNL